VAKRCYARVAIWLQVGDLPQPGRDPLFTPRGHGKSSPIADDFWRKSVTFVGVGMMKDYLITMGVLFAVYCLIRRVFILPPLPKHPRPMLGKGIDVTDVSERVKHLREELKENKVPGTHPDFKRALRVESKREEIAKLAFFQTPHPQPSEDSEHGHPLNLILV
jgi:hypothetical protein